MIKPRGRGYRKSRADYPAGVLGIYDNDGETADRYTVVYEPYDLEGELHWPITDMGDSPFYPNGVCLHGCFNFRITSSAWGNRQGAGRTINFADLPADCRRVIQQDLEPEQEAIA